MSEKQVKLTNYFRHVRQSQSQKLANSVKRRKLDEPLESTLSSSSDSSLINVAIPPHIPAYQKYAHLVSNNSSCSKLDVPGEEKSSISEDSHHVPAYQKYARLVSNNLNRLELPFEHKLLLDTFRAADQIVSIRYNRMELITFDILKPGVQQITRKNFELKRLGQFKTVYPEAYIFEQSEVQNKYENRAKEFKLTIAPNLDEDLKCYGLKSPTKTPMKRNGADQWTPPSSPVKFCSNIRSPTKTPTKVVDHGDPDSTVGRLSRMSGGRLLCRTEIFKKNLYKIILKEHDKFLASLSPPVILTADECANLQRWHPTFKLDTISDVLVADLPKPPEKGKICTAKEFLELGHSIPTKMENALKNVSLATSSKNASSTTSDKKIIDKAKLLKGIPADLLERIRAKERLKNQQKMLKPVESETKKLLNPLPDMINIINMYYMIEKKTSLKRCDVSKKVLDSYRALITPEAVEQHLNALLENASEWITEWVSQSNVSYLKIDKTCSVNGITTKIKNLIEKVDE